MNFKYVSTEEECRKIQLELTKKLILKNNFDLKYLTDVNIVCWRDDKSIIEVAKNILN